MVREKGFYQTLLKLSLPIALQGLATLLLTTLDTIMVSALGDHVLSGVTMATSLTHFLTMLLMGLAAGSTVLIAQYWGKRDGEKVSAVVAIGLWVCLLVSLVSSALLFAFPRAAMGLMTKVPEMIESGAAYLRMLAFSFVFYAITAVLSSTLRCVELVGAALASTLTSLALNVLLNYVFIFGSAGALAAGMPDEGLVYVLSRLLDRPMAGLGIPALGVRGAALATLIARGVECLILLFYVLLVQKRLRLRPRALLRLDRTLLKDYARYGLPVALGDSQWALIGVLKASIVGHLGPLMTAANGVAESMLSLVMIFSNSLTGGACVLIGKSVGERDFEKTRRYSGTIQILFAFVGVLMCTAVLLLRGPYLGLFYISPEARDLAMQLIAIGAFTMLGTSYHAACFMGINRGAGDSAFVFWVDMICGWLIVLPLSYLAAFVWRLPLPIVFLCIRVDQLFKWIIAFFRLRGNKWIKDVTRN